MRYFSYIALALSCLCSPPAFGDVSDATARVQSSYQNMSDLSADFTQHTRVAMLNRVIETTGNLHLKKGGKLRIDYRGADARLYISDGKALWVMTPGDPQSMQEFKLSASDVPREALSFLTGFAQLTKEFRVSESHTFHPLQAGQSALLLRPRSKHAPYTALEGLFDAEGRLIRLRILNPSGNVTEYTFSKIRINTGLDDRLFAKP